VKWGRNGRLQGANRSTTFGGWADFSVVGVLIKQCHCNALQCLYQHHGFGALECAMGAIEEFWSRGPGSNPSKYICLPPDFLNNKNWETGKQGLVSLLLQPEIGPRFLFFN
jgi:hypothetical protein